MQAHVIAGSRWLQQHRHQITVAAALAVTLTALLLATPLLFPIAAVEWKQTPRRKRVLSLTLLAVLTRATIWLWCELRDVPHGPWHPCAQCGRPIEAPSRAAYCSHACRNWARLERDALDNDPRIAEWAARRLRNRRFRDLADNDLDMTEVPF
jgi:hypothetical protein